jgi:hypothetical protein
MEEFHCLLLTPDKAQLGQLNPDELQAAADTASKLTHAHLADDTLNRLRLPSHLKN